MNGIDKSVYVVLVCAIVLASVVMPFSAMVNPSVIRAIEVAEDNGYIVIPDTFATDLSDIKSKTDLIPSDPSTYGNQTIIINQLGIMESSSYGKSIWAGKSADQSGDTWAEDTTMTPFRVTSGNNTWGTSDPAKILGLNDVPLDPTGTIDSILVVGNSSDTVYRIRFIWSPVSNIAGVAAGNYTEWIFVRGNADKTRPVAFISMPRLEYGNKLWAECWNATNGATLDFFIGAHYY